MPNRNISLLTKTFVTGACFLFFSISVFGWTESWESIRKTTDQVNNISSAFVQEKHLPLLKKPLISKGFLYYQKPDSLRWEYQTPIASILMSHRGDVARYLKQDGVFIKDAGSHVQAMQVVLNEITHWLGGRFDEGRNFNATLQQNGLIVLKPSNDQLTRMISRIELVLSKQAGLIDSVTIYENKNSFTRLVFKNCELNGTLDPSLFRNP